MLAFQIINSGKTIQINCDDQGMATLISALQKIRPSGGHVHLRGPSSGGSDLSEKTPWGESAAGEVILTWSGD